MWRCLCYAGVLVMGGYHHSMEDNSSKSLPYRPTRRRIRHWLDEQVGGGGEKYLLSYVFLYLSLRFDTRDLVQYWTK